MRAHKIDGARELFMTDETYTAQRLIRAGFRMATRGAVMQLERSLYSKKSYHLLPNGELVNSPKKLEPIGHKFL